MRISDWSSDVGSSDLDERYQHRRPGERRRRGAGHHIDARADRRTDAEEHQVDRPQRFPEAVIPRLMPNVIEALADEQAVLSTVMHRAALLIAGYAKPGRAGPFLSGSIIAAIGPVWFRSRPESNLSAMMIFLTNSHIEVL